MTVTPFSLIFQIFGGIPLLERLNLTLMVAHTVTEGKRERKYGNFDLLLGIFLLLWLGRAIWRL